MASLIRKRIKDDWEVSQVYADFSACQEFLREMPNSVAAAAMPISNVSSVFIWFFLSLTLLNDLRDLLHLGF